MAFHCAPEHRTPEHVNRFLEGQSEYWRQVTESEGFDIENIQLPEGAPGLKTFYCHREDYPYSVQIKRYARFGLHRYNLSHGTNFQLQHLIKFNMTMNCLASYYITLATTTPDVNFQVRVNESRRGRLNVTCVIARVQGTSSAPLLNLQGCEPLDVLPDWPSDFSDTKRFDEISESELKSNDWIRLYLELALFTDDRDISESELSQLQIIKVAVETIEENETHQPENETQQPKSINVYIVFKGLPLATIGEDGVHVERKVIVRRIVHEHTGYFTLLGGYGFSIGEVAKSRYISYIARSRSRSSSSSSSSVAINDRPQERFRFFNLSILGSVLTCHDSDGSERSWDMDETESSHRI